MKKTKQGFKLTLIVICLVVLLALRGGVFILGTEGTGQLPELPTEPAATSSRIDSEDPQNRFQQEAEEDIKQKFSLWNLITDALEGDKIKETEEVTFGIDVA